MRIAYTMAAGRGETDLLLAGVAQALVDRGLCPAGTVQFNSARATDGPCDMDVKLLPDGPILRISQNLGSGSRGCRLDPAALESAVGLAAARLAAGADCLIVNKFGKHETEGRGFRPLIADAVAREIPVLVGLNPLNVPGFEAFTGGLAVGLAPCAQEIECWLLSEIAERTQLPGVPA